MSAEQNKIIVFQEKQIRRVWHNEEWWFVVQDVVGALTDSKDVGSYIKKCESATLNFPKGGDNLSPPFR